MDAALEASALGVRAVKLSLVILGATAVAQAAVAAVTGSGALRVLAGFPLAEPGIRLVITLAILVVLKGAATDIYRRVMDAVDPDLYDAAEAALLAVPGVEQLRLRWVGHRILADIGLRQPPSSTRWKRTPSPSRRTTNCCTRCPAW